MNCAHVLGLIDAGPFADFPRAHLDAAWDHARQCVTCGPALEAATALTADLAALSHTRPSPDLTAAVLARIAQIEQPGPIAAASRETQASSQTPEWSLGATALGGLAATLSVVLSTRLAGGAPSDLTSAQIGAITAGWVNLPAGATWGLAVAASLGLYAVGLFTPSGEGRFRDPPEPIRRPKS